MAITNVSQIANSKGHAFKNIFSVQFTKVPSLVEEYIAEKQFTPLSEEQMNITAINIPTSLLGVAEMRIRGIIVSKISGTITSDTELIFEVRIDEDWENYKIFNKWNELYGDRATGDREISDNDPSELGQLIVSADDKIKWVFHDVVLIGFGETTFDHTVGDPMVTNLQFRYSYYKVE